MDTFLHGQNFIIQTKKSISLVDFLIDNINFKIPDYHLLKKRWFIVSPSPKYIQDGDKEISIFIYNGGIP